MRKMISLALLLLAAAALYADGVTVEQILSNFD